MAEEADFIVWDHSRSLSRIPIIQEFIKKKKPVIDGLPTMSSSQPENNRHEKTRVIITYNQERKQSIDSDSMCPQILDFTDKYKIHKEFKVKMI